MVTIVGNKGWGVIRWCIGIQNSTVKHALSDLTPPEASRSNIQTSSTVLLFSNFLKEANCIMLTTTSDGQQTLFKSTFYWVLSSTSKFLMQSERSTLLLYVSYFLCFNEPLLKPKQYFRRCTYILLQFAILVWHHYSIQHDISQPKLFENVIICKNFQKKKKVFTKLCDVRYL